MLSSPENVRDLSLHLMMWPDRRAEEAFSTGLVAMADNTSGRTGYKLRFCGRGQTELRAMGRKITPACM